MLLRRGVALVVALAALTVVWAAPASAHALLLRTEPTPQSTVAVSPPALRLFFSEAVEVSSGDLRLYDVDGKPVDIGAPHRVSGNTEVDVALPHLADGTYTVVWRAVSADSHPVRGGFLFYVGHPSSISPVAVGGDEAPSQSITTAFWAVRLLWFAALTVIVGLLAFRRFVWTPATRDSGDAAAPAAAAFRERFDAILRVAWVVLVMAAVGWLVFQTATSQGTSLISALRWSRVNTALGESFGQVWTAEGVCIAVLALPIFGLARRTRLAGVPPEAWLAMAGVLIWGLCVLEALTGHARTDSLPALVVAAAAVHLFAVTAWVGGLAVLLAVGLPSWRRLDSSARPALVRAVVRRFSRLAIVLVGVVTVTGIVLSWRELAAFSDLWRVNYGRVLTAKIVLLAAALAIAARHLLVTPRRLGPPAVEAGPGGSREVGTFSRLAAAEFGALAVAIALAAALIAMVPGKTIALAAQGPVNVTRSAGDYSVQLLVQPTGAGDYEVHVTFIDRTGLAAAGVTNTDVNLALPGQPAAPLAVRLIGPGHFVGDANLPTSGRYRIGVTSGQAATTFSFKIRKGTTS